jgi:hypothetical protein
MRQIHDHKVNGLNEAIKVTADDEAGPGGANHKYLLDLVAGAPEAGGQTMLIQFQNGPIKESGFNGFSNEALLAVVIDRMRGFQHGRIVKGGTDTPTVEVGFDFNSRGKYACRENALALTASRGGADVAPKAHAIACARDVEGTHAV